VSAGASIHALSSFQLSLESGARAFKSGYTVRMVWHNAHLRHWLKAIVTNWGRNIPITSHERWHTAITASILRACQVRICDRRHE